MLANALQALLDFIFGILGSAISALPDSPFGNLSIMLGEWAGWINYFVPVGSMVSLLAAYTSAVAVWYGIRWIFRFSRYIG